MWKLKQIFDGEYGCEERQPGEKEKCLVILANEELVEHPPHYAACDASQDRTEEHADVGG